MTETAIPVQTAAGVVLGLCTDLGKATESLRNEFNSQFALTGPWASSEEEAQ